MPIIFPRYPKVVLTGDADPGNVMAGKTFYKDDYKQKLTGTYVPAAPPVLDGDAGPGDVLAGKTFYKDDAYTKLTGTLEKGYQMQPGQTLMVNIPDAFHITESSFTKAVEFLMVAGGTYRVSFLISQYSGQCKAQIYVNGTASGILRSVGSPTLFTEDITVPNNGYIQIYCSSTGGRLTDITISTAPLFTTTIYADPWPS